MKNHFEEIYKQDLIDHAKNPHNYGLFNPCDMLSEETNPSCGDKIIICLTIKNGKIDNVGFEAFGCILSKAMASKLSVFIKNKDVFEVLNFNRDLIFELLGMELGLNRLNCGLLSLAALQKGLNLFLNRAKV